jgi:hypothetical protein
MTLSEHWARLRERRWFKPAVTVLLVGAIFVLSADAVSAFFPPSMDDLMFFLAQVVVTALNLVATLVSEIMRLLILVMQYNDFTTSPVVTTGWVIVRDIVNMFFVVVLIIIAFGTIFGSSRFKWQQQVPRLLIFAVVINFSKTLAGLLIDFGQVIGLTFVAAIQDIGAGNFMQLFGLDVVTDVSSQAAEDLDVPTGDAAFKWFAGAATAFIFLLLTAIAVVILTIVYVWRIVMLWVLVTIAPLAWFGGGVAKGGGEGVTGLSKLSDTYKKWWKYFTCAVGVGPILSFFLWLTLAVVGSGTFVNQDSELGRIIADQGDEQSVSGNLAAILELDNLIPFVLGMGMIFAGLDAALSICTGVPGAGGIVSGAKGALKSTLKRIPRAAGRGAAGLGAAGARKFGGSRVAGAAKEGGSSLLRSTARGARNVPLIGTGISALAGKGADVLEESRTKDVERASERLGETSFETDREFLEAANQRSTATTSADTQNAVMGKFERLMSNPKQLAKMDDEVVEGLWSDYGDKMEAAFKGDSSKMKTLNSFKKQRPDMAFAKDAPKEELMDEFEGTFREFGDVRNMSNESFEKVMEEGGSRKEALMEHLNSTLSDYTDRDGNAITQAQAILQGRAGSKMQRVLQDNQPDIGDMLGDVFNQTTNEFAGRGNEQKANQSRFEMALENSPEQLGQVDAKLLKGDNRSDALLEAISNAFDKKRIDSLPREYKKAEATGDVTKQRQLHSAMENAQEMLSYRAETSVGDKADKQRDRFKSIFEGLAPPPSLEDEMSHLTSELSDLGSEINSLESEIASPETNQRQEQLDVLYKAIENNNYEEGDFAGVDIDTSGKDDTDNRKWAEDKIKEIQSDLEDIERDVAKGQGVSEDTVDELQRMRRERLELSKRSGKVKQQAGSASGGSVAAGGDTGSSGDVAGS